MRSGRCRKREEAALLVAGVAGVVATIFACGSGDASNDGVTTDDGGSSGAVLGVDATCASDPGTADHTAAVVAAAEALLAALTPEQQTAIRYERTLTNAAVWSNFPTTFVQRNGVRIGDMSAEAQAAALSLASVAAGATGGTLLSELREADEFLVSDGRASSTDYGRGLYYLSIHGEPSTTTAWMLQIGGHHLAYNFMYGGACTSATPLFDGAEPMDWTDTDGTAHSPLEAQRAAMVALLSSVGSLADAKLSGTFGDLVNGPGGGAPGGGGPGGGGPGGGGSGGGDTRYPSQLTYPTGTTGRGVAVASLSAEQKTLVKTAIEAWVKNVADPISSALLAVYESDEALDQTYVGYSGSADLTTQSSYVRVDGPRVWIEVTVQGGVLYHDRVHYHTIWRDKAADYGAEFVSQ